MTRRGGPPTWSNRFVGNSSTQEVHDLDNEKTGPNECQIDDLIRAGDVMLFAPDTLNEAHLQGYDDCAHCIGG